MEPVNDARGRFGRLLAGQRLAVLATQSGGQPYASLVAFSFDEDLGAVYFATERGTRKHRNLVENPRVALLVDSRTHQEIDLVEAEAATLLGAARECTDEERASRLEAHVARHPGLSGFADSPGTALFRVEVETCLLVSRFGQVDEIVLRR